MLLQSYTPTRSKVGKVEIVQRTAMADLKKRLETWDHHATVLAGPYGSGKSTVLETSLTGQQGIIVVSPFSSSLR